MLSRVTQTAPAGLSIAALAQALYPEAFRQADLRETLVRFSGLLREKPRLSMPSTDGVTEAALERQAQALELALETMHERASALYFAKPGWTQHYLEQPGDAGAWYFLVARCSGSTSTSFNRCSISRKPQGAWNEDLEAVKVASDTVKVRMSLSTLGFSRFGTNPQYEGPASGLLDWARNRGVLVKRVEVSASKAH